MSLNKLLLSLFFVLSLFCINSEAENPYKNFEAKYSFEFSSMTVAKGVLRGKILDNNTYGVSFEGATTRFISFFYNLKEIIKGSVKLGDVQKDIFYESIEKRPKKTKIIYAKFLDNKTANVTIIKNHHKKIYLLKSEKGLYSPLSLYLFFMSNNIEMNKTYIRDVVVTKHIYKVAITILKKTTINLDKLGRKKGRRDALEVELEFYKVEKNGSVTKYKKVKKVVAWISTKPPFIPVFIKSWNFIGFFSARLTNLKVMR